MSSTLKKETTVGSISKTTTDLGSQIKDLRTRLNEASEDKRRRSALLRKAAPVILEALPHILAPRRWKEREGPETTLQNAVTASVHDALSVLLDATFEPGAPGEVCTEWTGEPPPRRWIISDWLPAGRLGLFSGPGGRGKSTLAVQLIAAIASGLEDWLPGSGLKIRLGKPATVILWSAEDGKHELHRRLKRIGWQDGTEDRLHYLDGAKACPLWAPVGGSGHISTRGGLTEEGAWVRAYAERVGAVLLVLDAAASAYGCDENARALVRAHCASWDAWGREHDCAVMLIGHPPKSGANYSGSTDWNAAARWRWAYDFEQIPGGGEDSLAPRLSLPKANYGLSGEGGRWIARNRLGPWVVTNAMIAHQVHKGDITNVSSRTATAPDTIGQGFDGVVA